MIADDDDHVPRFDGLWGTQGATTTLLIQYSFGFYCLSASLAVRIDESKANWLRGTEPVFSND